MAELNASEWLNLGFEEKPIVSQILAGTEVKARGLHWIVVESSAAANEPLYRLRCIQGGMRGSEIGFVNVGDIQGHPVPTGLY